MPSSVDDEYAYLTDLMAPDGSIADLQKAYYHALRSGLFGNQIVVRWDGTSWGTRPVGAEWGVTFLSTNDAAAPAPTDISLAIGDIWKRHPNAV